MTHTKRIAKLEAQVESLRRRLDSRTKQCIVLIDQIEQMKAALSEKDLEFTFTPIDLEDEPTNDAAITAGQSQPRVA